MIQISLVPAGDVAILPEFWRATENESSTEMMAVTRVIGISMCVL